MHGKIYDVAVIGGGIHGAAVARDAGGRGLSVFLCEQDDIASGASSATTKLVHGGIRYIEGFRLGAMREAVQEREILMRAAPHLVRPMTFLIPYHRRLGPLNLLRAGLFAFDRVAKTSLPRSRVVHLDADQSHGPLNPYFSVALAYEDCVVEDSRLVVLNALDARARGAIIQTRFRCVLAERDGGRWRLSLESTATGDRWVIYAKVLVNTAGAAAGHVANHVVQGREQTQMRTTKGAHLVIRRPPDMGDVGYALPNADGRIIYAVPFDAGTMVLGPAISTFRGEVGTAEVDQRDVGYLLDVAGQYFHTPIEVSDILWSFACVSTLPNELSLVRRERAIVVDDPPNVAPLISVFGGTLATHRRVAETVVDRMGKFGPLAAAWTAETVLPGGGFPPDGTEEIARTLRAGYPFVSPALARRLAAAYGTRAPSVLTGARSPADLGVCFGSDLMAAEIDYLRHEEWAETAEDVLWRRSKLGLELSLDEAAGLAAAMAIRDRMTAHAG